MSDLKEFINELPDDARVNFTYRGVGGYVCDESFDAKALKDAVRETDEPRGVDFGL